ncbi:MAG: HNH endonuclease [Cumulibacter sp.]
MPARPPRWCGKCRSIHSGECPARTSWQKPVKTESGRGGRPWRRLRKKVFERDGYCCQLCHQAGRVTIVTLHGSLAGICDHVIPKAEGGTDDESNLQTLCLSCSDAKTQAESLRGWGGSKP